MTRVLLIEDEAPLRETTAEMLTFEGMIVETAADGYEGLAKAEAFQPDIVVCDIMMPGKDGYQVLLELRSKGETANTPFIFLSALADRPDLRYGMELGADDYITKPFDFDELLAAIQTRLKARASQQAELESRMDELRGAVIRTLPHELRTPLFGLLGYMDLIQLDAERYSKEEIVQMIAVMERFGRRLEHLVENYLLYAQLEILRQDESRTRDLQALHFATPHTLIPDEATHIAQRHQRAADLEVSALSGTIAITEDNLRRIVREVVDNAFKYSEKGTLVRVFTETDDISYVIHVSDQGRGMTHQQINQIGAYMQFERQLYEQQGSGLGLAIAQRLATLHRGALKIESEPGVGTRATLDLLLKQP